MTRPPDFDELVGGVEQPDERERLRRVHELLVQAGPPPELSPELASLPRTAEPAVVAEEPDASWLPPRRLGAALVLAAALLVATFGVGYLVGGSGDESNETAAGVEISNTIPLRGTGDASGVVNVGKRDADGNWPMIVTVRGLQQLHAGDYYELALTKHGKPIVTCGTFNVAGKDQTSLRMIAAYNLKAFDGWVVTHWHAKSHDETIVLRTAQI
jgi:hypothetical protein